VLWHEDVARTPLGSPMMMELTAALARTQGRDARPRKSSAACRAARRCNTCDGVVVESEDGREEGRLLKLVQFAGAVGVRDEAASDATARLSDETTRGSAVRLRESIRQAVWGVASEGGAATVTAPESRATTVAWGSAGLGFLGSGCHGGLNPARMISGPQCVEIWAVTEVRPDTAARIQGCVLEHMGR
jgi:hypothetical protein